MKPSQEEIVQEARIEAPSKTYQNEENDDEVLLFAQAQYRKAQSCKANP